MGRVCFKPALLSRHRYLATPEESGDPQVGAQPPYGISVHAADAEGRSPPLPHPGRQGATTRPNSRVSHSVREGHGGGVAENNSTALGRIGDYSYSRAARSWAVNVMLIVP